MELVEQLKKDGIDKGLCRMWQMKLKQGLDYEALVKMFISGIDFCIDNDYPTLDFIREHFKGKSEAFGAYVDDSVDNLLNVPNVVLNGSCRAFIEYDGYAVANVYVRHTSKCSITISEYSYVTIDVFDDAEVAVSTSGKNANVLINVHGNAKVDCIGDGIKLIKKNNNTY